jgi:hypothetical protein
VCTRADAYVINIVFSVDFIEENGKCNFFGARTDVPELRGFLVKAELKQFGFCQYST